MANYKPNPTYYRVTWNQASPHDYTNLTDTRAGGLDAVSPYKYNNRVTVTGTQAITSTVMADGDTLMINQISLPFSSTDTLSDIIERINIYSMLTNVIAHNGVQSNYVTLTNGMGHCGEPIDVEEGTGALAKLGIAPGAYKNHPSVVGSAFSNFANGDSFAINGVTILMTTAGGLDQAGTVATINSLTLTTGVAAYRAGTKIQLTSLYGQPWTISGSNATKMGFNPGLYGGSPTNITLSLNKTLANMRWQMVVQQLEWFATPFLLNDQLGTGNYDGQTELTTMSFTVGYEHPDQIATADELNSGAMLYGTAAVKRAVARALVSSNTVNSNVFDPTLDTRGSYAVRPNPIRVMNLTADGIDIPSNLATIEGNISVTIISFAG